jgi:hypothetical protein
MITEAERGWVFDHGDPTVGIWPNGWTHEDCPIWAKDDDATQVIWERPLGAEERGEGANRLFVVTTRLECNCGASTEVTEYHWDPQDPEEES